MRDTIEEGSRSKRLKALTHDTHDRLDQSIVARRPFADRARYARFLAVQYGFHRDVQALYDHPALSPLFPGPDDRKRLEAIVQDLKDIGAEAPLLSVSPHFEVGEIDLATALGWLYVAEGSNLGAAFPLKWAAALDLDETNGARHLAPSPDGRAKRWRSFTEALDAMDLSESEEMRVVDGARAAFIRVHSLVADVFGEV
jgi:heme oxygenase